ncbi:MAG: tRNA (guanine(10)-N(2))-dimethyltransferase [Candidatus Bathyarchaeota archaeon]
MSFRFATEEVTESLVTLTIPKLSLFARGTSEYIPSEAPVFYNPLMELNRDLAILALRIYQKRVNQQLRICDPFTGCGVRGIRFAREVYGVGLVVLNDLSSQAAELAQHNVEKNGLKEKIAVENMDARSLLGSYTSHKGFDVIDLDPYGSPSPFLDFALVALKNRGLLALTATDTAPLCGVNPRACIRKYHGKPLRTEYSHELALRLLINSIVFSAAKYDLGVNVLFSHSTDHYIRAYVQVRHGAEHANETIENIGYILHCFTCLNRKWIYGLPSSLDRKCDVCDGELSVGGPMWLGKLYDEDFCRKMREEAEKNSPIRKKRLLQILVLSLNEVNMPPTYFVVDKICEKLGLSAVSRDRTVKEIIKMGYSAERTHFDPQGIKSNASISVIKEAVKKTISY